MAKTNIQNDTKDPTLDFVMKRFTSSRAYTRRYFWTTWDDCWKLYNNERVLANYEGNSDGFVPETFTIIQAVKAHVVGPNMKLRFLPTNKDQKGDVNTLNALFDFAWYQDKADGKVDTTILDTLVTGNGYLFQYRGEDNLPKNRYVPTNDAFFDPDASSYDDMRYAGYRYLTKLSELKEYNITNAKYDATDPKSTIKVPRYKNLDQVTPGFKENADKTAKELREEMMGGSATNSYDDVECIVYFDKEKMVTIANRAVVIEEEDTPFQRKEKTIQSVDNMGVAHNVTLPEIKPFLPFAPFRDYKNGALFYAKGEVEYIAELQERLNDTQNQKSDNLSFVLNRMWSLDPAYASKIDEIQSVPGAVFTIPPGALQEIVTPPMGTDADNEIARIKDEMRRATAADELIQGAASGGSMTATEVNAQLGQAGTRFTLKLQELENEGFRIMANNMFKIMQISITKEMAIRVVGPDGIEWKTYNPGEFLGDYDVQVMLKANALKVREEEKQNAMQFYLLASKQPFVNQPNLFKKTATQMFEVDQNEVDSLIQNVPPQEEKPKVNISLRGELPPTQAMEIGLEAQDTPGIPDDQATDASQMNLSPAGSVANLPGIPQA